MSGALMGSRTLGPSRGLTAVLSQPKDGGLGRGTQPTGPEQWPISGCFNQTPGRALETRSLARCVYTKGATCLPTWAQSTDTCSGSESDHLATLLPFGHFWNPRLT